MNNFKSFLMFCVLIGSLTLSAMERFSLYTQKLLQEIQTDGYPYQKSLACELLDNKVTEREFQNKFQRAQEEKKQEQRNQKVHAALDTLSAAIKSQNPAQVQKALSQLSEIYKLFSWSDVFFGEGAKLCRKNYLTSNRFFNETARHCREKEGKEIIDLISAHFDIIGRANEKLQYSENRTYCGGEVLTHHQDKDAREAYVAFTASSLDCFFLCGARLASGWLGWADDNLLKYTISQLDRPMTNVIIAHYPHLVSPHLLRAMLDRFLWPNNDEPTKEQEQEDVDKQLKSLSFAQELVSQKGIHDTDTTLVHYYIAHVNHHNEHWASFIPLRTKFLTWFADHNYDLNTKDYDGKTVLDRLVFLFSDADKKRFDSLYLQEPISYLAKKRCRSSNKQALCAALQAKLNRLGKLGKEYEGLIDNEQRTKLKKSASYETAHRVLELIEHHVPERHELLEHELLEVVIDKQ